MKNKHSLLIAFATLFLSTGCAYNYKKEKKDDPTPSVEPTSEPGKTTPIVSPSPTGQTSSPVIPTTEPVEPTSSPVVPTSPIVPTSEPIVSPTPSEQPSSPVVTPTIEPTPSEDIIPTPTPSPSLEGALTVDIYATNDIHGAVDTGLTLAKAGSYLKNIGSNDNTLLLDQGDTWQGSIYSNYNYGNLINDVMCLAEYDARTVGNHDFDWGIDKLKANTARSYNGYTIPVLAANIYDYDFEHKIEGDIQQSDIGIPTVSYVLENGLKVGIVGIIGSNQITSITSKIVEDICFKDHIESIKENATKLRKEGCDIVIASCHTGQDDLKGNNLDQYVDLVLCGHTHRDEQSTENGVTYAQFGANGETIGHITLEYDAKTKEVSTTCCDEVSFFDINKVDIDEEIQSLIDTYKDECRQEADKVVASNVVGRFYKAEQAANLMCKAVYDQCVKENQEVILSFCNTGRAHLYAGTWTYDSVYQTFPFDNLIYIIEITGYDLIHEVREYNNVYFNPSFNHHVNINERYRIAVIDYLAFHTNANRYYDYFSSFDGHPVGCLKDNYRIILRNWLSENGYTDGKALYASDYSSSVSSFDRTLLYS